jgi:hypothetical protein
VEAGHPQFLSRDVALLRNAFLTARERAKGLLVVDKPGNEAGHEEE